MQNLVNKSKEKCQCQMLNSWRLKDDFSTPHPLSESSLYYQVDRPTFQSMCRYFAWENIKVPLLALHATPGLGKSSLLDQFCKMITDWKRTGRKHDAINDAPDSLLNAIFVTVTFNFRSLQNSNE